LTPKRTVLVLLNLACLGLFAFGKQTVNQPVATAPGDTAVINRLIILAEDNFESEPDSTAAYAGQAILLSQKASYAKGMANGYVQLATVNNFKGNYTLASKHYTTALNLYQQIKNQFGVSEAYMGLAQTQDYLGRYTNAISLFEKALAIRIKLGNQIDIANCYAVMGITYNNKGQFSTALDYYFKALMIDLKLNNQLAAADNYCNIGVVMQHLELYPKALDFFNKANTLWLKLHDKQGISTCYQNIGEVMLAQKKYASAFKHFQRASVIYHELGDEEGKSLIYYDLGLYYYYTARPDSAVYYLNKSLASATANKIIHNKAYAYVGLALIYNLEKEYKKALNYALFGQQTANKLQSINTRADAALQVSKALAGLKQFDEAYQQHLLYAALKDSLNNDESLQKLTSYNLAIAFENSQHRVNKKEAVLVKKIEQKELENLVYAIIIVIITIMMVIYYNAKRKQLRANAMLAYKNKEVLIQADKLNELNTLKDRLISILAHDLRAPLSTLRGLFSLMTAKGISHDEFIEMAPRVFTQLEYTSDFLDTLLFWINSQVDDTKQTIKSFCLSDVVAYELNLLDEQFRAKDITPLNTVTAGSIVLADPNSIRIVIHNFMTNAIKFSHPGSIIEISAYPANKKEVALTVTDQGIGMSEKQLNSLFKNKVVSRPGTNHEIGTGMGLIFCKDLIEKYNGRIWAKSTPGESTELGFALPADIKSKAAATELV
jgi:signal transduction histidine kinase